MGPLRIGKWETLIIFIVAFFIWGFWAAVIISLILYFALNWMLRKLYDPIGKARRIIIKSAEQQIKGLKKEDKNGPT